MVCAFSEVRTGTKAWAALELRDRVAIIKHMETDTCPLVLSGKDSVAGLLKPREGGEVRDGTKDNFLAPSPGPQLDSEKQGTFQARNVLCRSG